MKVKNWSINGLIVVHRLVHIRQRKTVEHDQACTPKGRKVGKVKTPFCVVDVVEFEIKNDARSKYVMGLEAPANRRLKGGDHRQFKAPVGGSLV